MATKEERLRQETLSLLGNADKIAETGSAAGTTTAKTIQTVSQMEKQKVEKAGNTARQIQEKYDNYIKSPEARQYQKTWGKQSDTAIKLQEARDDSAAYYKQLSDRAKLDEYAALASTLKNTGVQTEVDKARAINLGKPETKGLLPLPQATEAQRQQKMGYSTWNTEKYQALTDDEAEIYNRLKNNGYDTEAQAFLDALDSTLNYRVTKARTDTAAETTKSGVVGWAAGSAASTLLNTIGTGLTAEIDAITARRKGEAIDQYSENMYGRNLSSALRGAGAEAVGDWAATLPVVDQSRAAESGGVAKGKFSAMPIEQQQESNRKIAEFLYNTGMSMVDMVAMSPFGSTGMAVIMGTNSAADTLIDAKNRGLSDDQAMTVSTVAGLAEVLAEKYSLDRLFDGNISENMVKAAFTQGGIEASEEAVTELANILADVYVSGSKSEYQQLINTYMDEGMDRMAAERKAAGEFAMNIVTAAAGGALSGAVMGGAMDIIQTNAQGGAIIDQVTQFYEKQGQDPFQARQSAINYLQEELRAVGAMAEEGTVANKLSQQTGDMSTGDIGRAYMANAEAEQGIVRNNRLSAEEASGNIDTAAKTGYDINNGGTINGAEETKAGRNAGISGQTVTKPDQGLAGQAAPVGRKNYRGIGSPVKDIISKQGVTPVDMKTVNEPSSFYAAISAAKQGNPHGAYVTAYDAEDYAQMQLFMSDDGGVGVAVKDDGDIISVFKNPKKSKAKKAVSSILLTAIENGGTKLDNFDGTLSKMYLSHGFIPVARTSFVDEFAPDGWNYERDGRPDIIFWIHNGDSAELTARNIGTQEMPDLSALPLMDYDAAAAYRDTLINKTQLDRLKQRYTEQPIKLSREGIEIRRKISDLQNQQAESEIKEVDLYAPEDMIAGSEAPTEDVRNALENQKRLERQHEKLKKEIRISDEDASAIETFVKTKVPIERAITAYMDKLSPQIIGDYYESFKALNDARNNAVNYRKEILNRRYNVIRDAIGSTIAKWEDKKSGFAYARGTQERNIRDITKNAPEAGEWIIKNIHEVEHRNEAARTRWANRYADRARALGLTETENAFTHVLITERDLEQRLAQAKKQEKDATDKNNEVKAKEAKSLIKQIEEALDETKQAKAELVAQDPNMDEERLNKAADEILRIYREIYDELVAIQMKNGMEVTEFRQTYAPVVKDKKNRTVMGYIGFEMGAQEIPTSLAGLTDAFKPGKPWFSHNLQRTGYRTAFDVLGGLDEYLKSAGDVIFHTDDNQNIRMLENIVRSSTTQEYQDETVKEWIADGITGDELTRRIEEEFPDRTHLSNYVRNLREYGNLLANKKSILDRGLENLFGRNLYRTMNNIRARITSNVLGGNISVVLSQAIPLTQALSVVSGKNLMRGFNDAGRNYAKDDGFNTRSTFITNRQGYKSVAVKDAVGKINEAVAKPFEVVDEVVTAAIVRGRYYDNIEKGMSEAAAMRDADRIAAALMADRSKGALPTLFGSKNPISALFTMFQVESNNQWDFMLKDLKEEATEISKGTGKSVAAVQALLLSKAVIAAFGYNELRKLLGMTANALDPINWLRDISDEIRKGIEDEQSVSTTVSNIWEETSDQIPFIGGGRYGSIYENALPDLGAIADAAANIEDGVGGKYFAKTALQEFSKPVLYLALPTGGGQLKKTAQAAEALIRGGSYKTGKDDEDRLQYTVAPTAGNIVGGLLLGKGAFKENKEWQASAWDSFTTKEQDVYQSAKSHGSDAAQFARYRTEYKNMVEEDSDKNDALYTRRDEIMQGNPALTKAEAMERAEMDLGYSLQNSAMKWAQRIAKDTTLTDAQKADYIALGDLGADDITALRSLVDFGVPAADYVAAIATLSKYDSITTDVKKEVSQQIYETNLTPRQKEALARKTINDDEWIVDYSSEAAFRIANEYGKSAYKKYAEARDAYGMTAEQYIDFKDKEEADAFSGSVDGKTVYYLKQCRLANYVDNLDAPESVKKYIWDSMYPTDKDCEYENRHNKLKQVDGVWYTSGGYN